MKKWFLFLVFGVALNSMAQQINCQQGIQRMQVDSLTGFVRKLTGLDPVVVGGNETYIRSRYATHPGNDVAAEYLKQTLIGYGFTIEDIPYSASGRNIVAYKAGTITPKKAYLAGAHYDCVGSSTMDFQGADDNASGVAALLEMARVFSNDSFPNTLVLALWDEEEIGLIGSQAFAPDGPLGYWDVLASINLDMIGYDGNHDSLAKVHTSGSGYSTVLAQKIIESNRLYQIGLNMTIKNPGDRSTDHQSFWAKGATAIGLTEDYDDDFSPHWHQQSDSIANMNIPYWYKMSRLAAACMCDITTLGNYTSVNETGMVALVVYPNPTIDILYLPNFITNGRIQVYSSTGQLVQESVMNESVVSVVSLPAGLYRVIISTAAGNYQGKFLKQ